VADAVTDGMPILVLYADRDRYPARAMPDLQDLAGEAMTVEVISGRAHGMDVLATEPRLLDVLVGWVAGL
ncbi:MAG: hypothetical protein MUC99_13425, partial [Anaerolineae bacterium]|nr:hypothetical protein [Anaerolineae bacterium]